MSIIFNKYQNVENETMKKFEDKIRNWQEETNNWINEWYEMLSEERWRGIETPLLFVERGIGFEEDFNWIQHCVLSGAYHQAFRELRYLLEMMVQAYFLDTNHSDAMIETKMEILKALENLNKPITGCNFIDKTDLGNKKKLKKLYKDLSGFVHPSFKEIQSKLYYTIQFNEKLFNDCKDKFTEVLNALKEITKSYIKQEFYADWLQEFAEIKKRLSSSPRFKECFDIHTRFGRDKRVLVHIDYERNGV